MSRQEETAAQGEQTEPRAEGERRQRWLRRPRSLRRQLAGTLVLVALTSVLLVGGLNFVAARQLLDEGTKAQLVGVGEARARTIDRGIDRVLGQTSTLAADLAVVDSLRDLTEGYQALAGERLTTQEDDEIDNWYRSAVLDPLNDLDLDEPVVLEDVEPGASSARYVQYQYIINVDPDDRPTVDDAGDGSQYSASHSSHHQYLSGLANATGASDLMLVDVAGNIVYSSQKDIDFGTSLVDGPYADTSLADTVMRRLAGVPIGQAVLADMELYLPARAKPVTFVAAAVRRNTEVIGALVMQVPVSALNAITTSNQRWEEVGLSTGESYVVGADRRLVSESRLWIEDSDGYLEHVDDERLASLITALGSPVGLQPVDTSPVEAALNGRRYEGITDNYLGQRTFSYATPITASGVEWVVVADIPLAEARGPLYDYGRTVGLVLLIILPVAAISGLWLADRLTRPIAPVVEAAMAVVEGERNPDIPDLGRDEFGDLARRLRQIARDLEEQEKALAAEFDERRRLLLSVLPPRMVEAHGVASGSGDAAEPATVIAVALQSAAGALAPDEAELAAFRSQALAVAEEMADGRDIERVRASADQYLFLAGIGTPSDEADAALDFADALTTRLHRLASNGEVKLDLHIGLSSGPVATGMLELGSLTFAAWGEPVRRALALAALSRSDEILVDANTAASASTGRWSLVDATDVIDLDGQAMPLFTVASRRNVEATAGAEAD